MRYKTTISSAIAFCQYPLRRSWLNQNKSDETKEIRRTNGVAIMERISRR
jgi:hypothetical protein